ncbi:DnaB-like helicase C-terminal domain-containing protein [Francisella sp. LA112445]|uniref:DnaB-like helicase C-terminal domain-containing protein n=1 Tax=Francisella sp. LA112445 TaxID=1395624 RepID=UPI001788B9BB|nr:DnaB-like helicase C-terminal domain-containing protein [Francisella sp. LA112445]QIW10573.1 hypothetical protein FIP56_07615 [Francisella sp. LA112445]
MNNNTKLLGAATGISSLDNMLSGLQEGKLYLVGSRPAIGKSTLGFNLAKNISSSSEKPALIFSLEMSCEDIVARGHFNFTDNRENNNRLRKVEAAQIYIDDSVSMSPNEMRSTVRDLYNQYDGLSLVVVDYLQLMKIPDCISDRTQEISEILRSLKSLAKEFEVPIIVLSQLSRNVDSRENKRPKISDIREYTPSESNVDVIMLMYTDGLLQSNTSNGNNKSSCEIIVLNQLGDIIGIVHTELNQIIFR